MASGCIIGDCILCNELIFEDESYSLLDGEIVHHQCKKDYRYRKFILKRELIDFIENRKSDIHKNYFHFQEAEKELSVILNMLKGVIK